MITKSIVFIIGAGASKDFGFPTGQELIKLIISNFSHYVDEIYKELLLPAPELNIEINRANEIHATLKNSRPASIDHFMKLHPEYSELLKAIIYRIITEKQIKHEENNNLLESWLSDLWHKMIDDCFDYESFKQNRIHFITFNYDIVLETFFTRTISNLFSSTTNVAIDKIIPFKIIHVFGNLIEPLKHNPSKSSLWFQLGSKIKTIYESTANNIDKDFKYLIDKAEEIHFVGFGFHKMNLDILSFDTWDKSKVITGSRIGLSNAQLEDINVINGGKLRQLSRPGIENLSNYVKNHIIFNTMYHYPDFNS
jgi:hypothetical protein